MINSGTSSSNDVLKTSLTASISFKWCALAAEKGKCAEFVKYVNVTAQNLSLDVTASCVDGSSSDDCIAKIKDNKADLVTLDGRKVYDAGKIIMHAGKAIMHPNVNSVTLDPQPCLGKQHFLQLRHEERISKNRTFFEFLQLVFFCF